MRRLATSAAMFIAACAGGIALAIYLAGHW